MIKRCPSCNRTYSDESISFCLADGALLSAPYASSKDEAPATEILPAPGRAAVPPTQPAQPPIPTIAGLPEFRGVTLAETEGASPGNRSKIWVAVVCAALTLAGVGLVVRYAMRDRTESANAVAQPDAIPVNSTPASTVSPNAGTNPGNNPATPLPVMNASPGDKSAAKSEADPKLSPPDSRQPNSPAASPAADSSKIFRGSEVDQKPRILSKPEASYTEEARKNQIDGTVVLRVVLSADGTVTNIHPVSGLPNGLTERAMAAASQIKFVPATKDGRPVSMWMELRYSFNLY
jgi:TonB family protein